MSCPSYFSWHLGFRCNRSLSLFDLFNYIKNGNILLWKEILIIKIMIYGSRLRWQCSRKVASHQNKNVNKSTYRGCAKSCCLVKNAHKNQWISFLLLKHGFGFPEKQTIDLRCPVRRTDFVEFIRQIIDIFHRLQKKSWNSEFHFFRQINFTKPNFKLNVFR